MIKKFLFLGFLLFFFFYAEASKQEKKNHLIISGYFIQSRMGLLLSKNPDSLLPSIRVSKSSMDLSQACVGGPRLCREIQADCLVVTENSQKACSVKKILPSRAQAKSELKIWKTFF